MEMQAYAVVDGRQTIRQLFHHYQIFPGVILNLHGVMKDLAKEVWNDPLNAPLRAAANRPMVEEQGVMTPRLEPDEKIYLPLAVPKDTKYQRFDITGEKNLDEVCEKIEAIVNQTPFKTWPRRLDAATICGVSLNVGFLRKNPDAATKKTITNACPIFYWTVPKYVQDLPVAPAGSNQLVALPAWMFDLWGHIERIRENATKLEGLLETIFEIRAHGALLYGATTGLGGFLKILKAHTHSRLDDFKAKVDAFASSIEANVLKNQSVSFVPEAEKVAQALYGQLHDPELQKLADKLNAAYRQYPLTVIALSKVIHRVTEALFQSSMANDLVKDLDAIIKGEKPGSFLGTLFTLNMNFMNGPGAILGRAIGNALGPMSLAVCVTRGSLLAHLPSALRANAPTLDAYAKFLAGHLALSKDQAAELTAAVKGGKVLLGPTALKIKAAEMKAANTQSSTRWAGSVGILNLMALAGAVWQFKGDLENDKDRLTLANDVAGILSSSVATGAAVLQGLVNFDRFKALLPATVAVSYALSVLGIITGAITLWQGYHEDDAIKKWAGFGSILASSGCILDMLVIRWGSQIAIRFAAMATLEALGVEAGVLMVGAAFSTILTGVGLVIVIGSIVVANWPAIKEAFGTTGPEKYCRALLQAITDDDRFALFPGAVKIAYNAMAASFGSASLDDFKMIDRGAVTQDLKVLHLEEAELKLIFDRAILSNFAEAPPTPYYFPY